MVTVSNPPGEAVREGSLPELPSAEDPTRRGAQRANSITPPAPIALDAVTQSARWVRARLGRLLSRPQPGGRGRPGFPQAREWHHECAAHYRWNPAARWARLAWGYGHLLLVKSVTDFTEWVTESPARFCVALAVGLAVWYGR